MWLIFKLRNETATDFSTHIYIFLQTHVGVTWQVLLLVAATWFSSHHHACGSYTTEAPHTHQQEGEGQECLQEAEKRKGGRGVLGCRAVILDRNEQKQKWRCQNNRTYRIGFKWWTYSLLYIWFHRMNHKHPRAVGWGMAVLKKFWHWADTPNLPFTLMSQIKGSFTWRR